MFELFVPHATVEIPPGSLPSITEPFADQKSAISPPSLASTTK